MTRAALALLLACATVVAAVPAAAVVHSGGDAGSPAADAADTERTAADRPTASIVRPDSNTTNYLALPPESVERTRFDTVSLDAMGSVAVDDGRIHGRYELQRIQRAYIDAPNESAERAVVRRAANHLTDEVERLVARERRVLVAYNAGELSTQSYLRELAAIDAEARQLEQAVNQLHSYSQASDAPVTAERLVGLKVGLLTLQGPVRQRVGEAMTGEVDRPTRVFVRTSDSGVVLSMVVHDDFSTDYVREAYLGSALNLSAPDQYGSERASERIFELYPWADENSPSRDSILTSPPLYFHAGVYGIGFNHDQGGAAGADLVVFLDSGTDEVFREYQYKAVSRVPTRQLATNTTGDLRIAVNGTRVGGPLEVHVVNTTTGEPVAANVSVAGQPLGPTDAEGRLWTVAPRASFNVTVTEGNRTVRFGVTAAEIQFGSS